MFVVGGYIVEVRVQLVMVWVWLFLGNNFDLIVYLQLVGEWYDVVVNFGVDVVMVDIVVNMIGKVEWC